MSSLFRTLTFVFLCLASTMKIDAIQNTRLFNSSDILSSNYSSFCIDKEGFLWIGTQSGLLRFDGSNFDKYLHDENSETSLSDNRIMKILRDSNDRLWIGTCEGLNLYNPDTDDFTRVTLPNLDLYGYIFDVCQMPGGDIVFQVSGVGPFIIDFSTGEPVAVKYMPQIENLGVLNVLCATPKGELIGGNHAGDILKIYPNGQTKEYKVADSYIRIIIKGNDDTYFISTTNKAWIWDYKNDTFTPIKIFRGGEI